jgi:hypothetical protein
VCWYILSLFLSLPSCSEIWIMAWHRPEHAWSCSLQDACGGWWVSEAATGKGQHKSWCPDQSIQLTWFSSVRPPRRNQGAYIINFYRLTRHSSFTCLPNSAHTLKRSLMARTESNCGNTEYIHLNSVREREREREREITRSQQLITEIDCQYYYLDYKPVLLRRRYFLLFPYYYSFGSNTCIFFSDRHTCLCQLASVVHNYVPNG